MPPSAPTPTGGRRERLGQVQRLVPADLSALIPDEYRQYRSLVRSALLFFFARLSAPRRAELRSIGRRRRNGSVFDQVLALLLACPSLHKLGQVVARDRRLSPEFRARLALLEVLPPTIPTPEVIATILRERPGLDREVELGPVVLAEGSVAAVLPFTYGASGNDVLRHGVLKVLKPGIEARLEEELEIWPDLGSFLEEECGRLGLPTPDYRDAVLRTSELLRREIDLDGERRNLALAASTLGSIPGVAIPEPLPFSGRRLLAMTRLFGRKITELEGEAQTTTAASTIADVLLARPMLQAEGEAFFHADPHAGNLMATDDGRVGIIDWSLVGRLQKSHRVALVQILVGAITFDHRRIARAVRRLASTGVDSRAVERSITDALSRLRLRPPGLDWLFELLDDLAFRAAVRFPGDLILFRKSLLTLEGLLEELRPGFSLDRVVLRRTLEQALRDWPQRWFANPFDRGFATHLSNADWLGLLGTGPLAAARVLGHALAR